MIVTFYSFKGGVGRSMALANVAEILAGMGFDVIACDWDLEAPGLERYFSGDREEAEELLEHPGVMDLLSDYQRAVSTGPDPEAGHEGPDGDEDFCRLGKLWLRRPQSVVRDVTSRPHNRGRVRLMTAGRRRGDSFDEYTRAVQTFDWREFYRAWAGGSYMEFFRQELEADCDIVLIDSRTGITEQGGVCTHHLADLVVLLTAANDLNIDGTHWMASSLTSPDIAELRGGRELDVLPVASRIEQTAEKEGLVGFRNKLVERIGRWVPKIVGEPEHFLRDTEIPYMPFYSFTERVAARESEAERETGLFEAYRRLTDCIVRLGVSRGLVDRKGAHSWSSGPTDIYLSHDSRDQGSAEWIAQALQNLGWSVAWKQIGLSEPELATRGEHLLQEASCVVVLWSPRSVRSERIHEEAIEADQRGILVPALIQEVDRLPLGFRRIQPASLSNWKGEPEHGGLLELVRAAAALTGLPDEAGLGESERAFRDRVLRALDSEKEPRRGGTREGARIFLSYAREDLKVASQLARVLEEEGYSVFWDRQIPVGRSWSDTVGEELARARCVVALWSKRSVESDWVLEEAEEGRRNGHLMPVRIEEVRLPLGFSRFQTLSLVGWDGERSHPAVDQLLLGLETIVGRPH